MSRILGEETLARIQFADCRTYDVVCLVDNVRRLKEALAIALPWAQQITAADEDEYASDMARIRELVGE